MDRLREGVRLSRHKGECRISVRNEYYFVEDSTAWFIHEPVTFKMKDGVTRYGARECRREFAKTFEFHRVSAVVSCHQAHSIAVTTVLFL